jgi:hypothetical protein
MAFFGQPTIATDPTFFNFTNVKRGQVLGADMRIVAAVDVGTEVNERAFPVLVSACDQITFEALHSHADDGPGPGLRGLVRQYHVRVDTASLQPGEDLYLSDNLRAGLPGSAEGDWQSIPIHLHFQRHPIVDAPHSLLVQARNSEGSKIRVWSKDGRIFRIQSAKSSLTNLNTRLVSVRPANVQEIVVALSSRASSNATIPVKGFIEILVENYPSDPFRVDILVVP